MSINKDSRLWKKPEKVQKQKKFKNLCKTRTICHNELMKKLPLFAKFTVSSLVSAGVDFMFFFLVQKAMEKSGYSVTNSIVVATALARVLSTAVNFLINKFWSFESQQNSARQVILFIVLFLGKMGASAALVAFLAFLPVPAVTLKIIVDTLLFFVSFIIQKHFIF